MTNLGSTYTINSFRRQALVGMVRFKIHHLNLPLPWRISRETPYLVLTPPGDDTVVVCADGRPVAVLPSLVASALVTLSEHNESDDYPFDFQDVLYKALLLSVVRQFDPRLWSIRQARSTDPAYALIGASEDAYVVGCGLVGDLTSRTMLSFSTRAMAERLQGDAERVRMTYSSLLV